MTEQITMASKKRFSIMIFFLPEPDRNHPREEGDILLFEEC